MTKNPIELLGIARFKIHEGKLEEFKRLSSECIEIVRTKDTGTLEYQIFINEDESECMVIERYKDFEALMEHGKNLGDDLSKAVLATGEVYGELLGDLTLDQRANFAGSPVQVFSAIITQ